MKHITLKLEIPEGYELIKREEVRNWEDLGEISGFFVEQNSRICFMPKTRVSDDDIKKISQIERNVWVTEEQAAASLAMSQLSQLMKYVNGDWEPNWENGSYKYCLEFSHNIIHATVTKRYHHFLTFPTKYIRDQFSEKHRVLIELAKPLL